MVYTIFKTKLSLQYKYITNTIKNKIKTQSAIDYLSQAYPSSLTKSLHIPFYITFTFFWKTENYISSGSLSLSIEI